MTGQKQSFFCDVFSQAVAGSRFEEVHEIGAVEKGMFCQPVNGEFFGKMTVDIEYEFPDYRMRGDRFNIVCDNIYLLQDRKNLVICRIS